MFAVFHSFKQAYDLTQLISPFYYKGYASLTKIQQNEWNNRWEISGYLHPYCMFFSYSFEPFCRGMSSAHAIFITIMSLYFVFFSDLFSDRLEGLVTFRSSNLSTFTLGVTSLSFSLLSWNVFVYLNICFLRLYLMLHFDRSLLGILSRTLPWYFGYILHLVEWNM